MTTLETEHFQNGIRLHGAWLTDPSKGSKLSFSYAVIDVQPLEPDVDLSQSNFLNCTIVGDAGGANLSGARFVGCTFHNFKHGGLLFGTKFVNCTFVDCSFKRSKLDKNTDFGRYLICPKEGCFRGYKKVWNKDGLAYVIELLISKTAKRTNMPGTRKCRCSRAKVLRAFGTNGKTFHSGFDTMFSYKVGHWAEITNFDPTINQDCTAGIHFFMTREEAEAYGF